MATREITNNSELLEALISRLEELHAKVDGLLKNSESAAPRAARQSQRAMTDEDARKVLGEMSNLDHNEAAQKLGLSYGQVYSARLGYTFKGVRKELSDGGAKNQWLDTTHNG